jgi:hypothetical protein
VTHVSIGLRLIAVEIDHHPDPNFLLLYQRVFKLVFSFAYIFIEQEDGRMGGSAAETIRQPRDRLTGHPQERQHSDGEAGARDRVPPARGTL